MPQIREPAEPGTAQPRSQVLADRRSSATAIGLWTARVWGQGGRRAGGPTGLADRTAGSGPHLQPTARPESHPMTHAFTERLLILCDGTSRGQEPALKDVDEKSARKTPWKGLEGLAPVPDEICVVEAFRTAANHRQ